MNLHRVTATIDLDATTEEVVPGRLAREGVSPRQWQDIRSAAVLARVTGSVAAITTVHGVKFRISRARMKGFWHVAAVVPERDAIQRKAAELLALLDDAVPNSTAHYAVEGARSALATLVSEAPGIVTRDTKES